MGVAENIGVGTDEVAEPGKKFDSVNVRGKNINLQAGLCETSHRPAKVE